MFKSTLLIILLCNITFSVLAYSTTTPPPPNDAKHSNDAKAIIGYLSDKDIIYNAALFPPPPNSDSAAFKADEEYYDIMNKLRDTPRWSLAIQDASLEFPGITTAFSCVLNAPINENDTPTLYQLMRRTRGDIRNAIYKVKDHYKRARPFAVKNISTCTPFDEPKLIGNGAYPSGHSATGWLWALILAEIAPERADLIINRGLAYGYSRLICGVHWWSDVNAGFLIAAAVNAKLHANQNFRSDIETARAEVAAAYSKELKPTRNCQFESEALSIKIPSLNPEN